MEKSAAWKRRDEQFGQSNRNANYGAHLGAQKVHLCEELLLESGGSQVGRIVSRRSPSLRQQMSCLHTPFGMFSSFFVFRISIE